MMRDMSKLTTLRELGTFLRKRRLYWLGPLLAVLVLLGFLIVVAESTALAPFIYTLF